MTRSRTHDGFTLLEMTAVLALAALLLAVAVPGMSDMADNARIRASTQALHASLNLARSEAIKRNARVVLCKSANGLVCTSAGGWEQGWIVFHDLNNNAALDPGESLLLREGSVSATLRFSGNAQIKSYVSYTPLGMTKTTGGGFQAGTWTVCRQSAGPTTGRQVVISSSGRVRTQKAELSNCA